MEPAAAQATQDKDGATKVADAIANASSLLGVLKTACSTASSDTIGPTTPGRGFSDLRQHVDITDMVVPIMNLAAFAALMPVIHPDLFQRFPLLSHELSQALLCDVFHKTVYTFTFANGRGEVDFLQLIFEPGPRPGTVRHIVRKFSGSFGLAPDIMLTTHVRERFLSSKTWQTMHFIERGVNPGDMDAFMRMGLLPLLYDVHCRQLTASGIPAELEGSA